MVANVTPHESDILTKRRLGLSPSVIAEQLGISRSTVYRCYRRHGLHAPVDSAERERRTDTQALLARMLGYVNGRIDKDGILATMSEYELRWVDDHE